MLYICHFLRSEMVLGFTNSFSWIQLFRQRLSHESVKAYATMPIGIMGSKSFSWLRFKVIQQQGKRNNEYAYLCCFLPPRWNTWRFTQAPVKSTITHNNFRHCRVSFSPFVRQRFSKQLYSMPFPVTETLPEFNNFIVNINLTLGH